jgi:Succinyl-CoA synthetase, beta subunit
MNLHEYQSKGILKKAGVPIPLGKVAFNPAEAVSNAKLIMEDTGTDTIAVKAQIHAGGRGKGGGVKIAKSIVEVEKYAKEIIGMTLVTHQTDPSGKLVRKVLIEQGIYQAGPSAIKEFYISILLNRATGRNMVVYSPQGGMDIEAVAAQTPQLIFKEEINPIGIQPYQAKKVAINLGLTGKAYSQMVKFVTSLYDAYTANDLSLLEINPVVKTSNDDVLAADAKCSIDDNALYRHPEFEELRDIYEEDPAEVEAGENNLNFVKLDGKCWLHGKWRRVSNGNHGCY